jgi:hypothetical protein
MIILKRGRVDLFLASNQLSIILHKISIFSTLEGTPGAKSIRKSKEIELIVIACSYYSNIAPTDMPV